jgi:hypothetical protein
MEKEGKKERTEWKLFNLASINLLSLFISSLFEYMRCI